MSRKFSRIPTPVAVLLMLPLIGAVITGCATTVDPAGNDLSVETRIRLAEMAAAAGETDRIRRLLALTGGEGEDEGGKGGGGDELAHGFLH